MINKSDIIILNPAYFLRNDLTRAVLGTFDFPSIQDGRYEKNSLHIIHPYTAIMLSFFDGKRTFGQCINDIASYFELQTEEAETLLLPYIENTEPIYLKYDDSYTVLPVYLLIKANGLKRHEIYTPDSFEISETIDLQNTRLNIPVKVIVEMNFNCYTDCAYCYADRFNANAKKPIAPEKLISLVHEMQKLRIPSLEINGGEILLHPSIKDILAEMSASGYTPFISTKVPLNKEILEYLKSYGFNNIQISLDSVCEKTLTRLLNVREGYLSKIKDTIKLLDDLHFEWQVNTVITHNVDIESEVTPLLEFLNGFAYIRSHKFNTMGFPMYKPSCVFEDLKADLKDLNALKCFLDNFKQYCSHDIIFAEPSCKSDFLLKNKLENFKKRSVCSANQKGFVVLPNGDVTICEELYWHPSFIIGNIYNQSIMDIWNSQRAKDLFYLDQKTITRYSQCGKCETYDSCRFHQGVCWKMVIMAYGDNNWSFPDPGCPKAPMPLNPFYY